MVHTLGKSAAPVPPLVAFLRIALFLGIAIPAFALTGCKNAADLDTVRKLAATASSSQNAFDSVAQDVLESCERVNRWNQLDSALSLRLAQLHPEKNAGAPIPAVTTIDCVATHKLAVARWKATNALYLGYFVALGKIAGSGNDSSAYGFKNFATALKSAGTLATDAQTAALSKASSDIVDAFINARRERSIAQFAGPDGEGTKYVALLADDLEAAAAIHDKTLATETGAINVFYETGLRFTTPTSDVVSIDHHFQDHATDLAAVESKHAAIAAYVNSVENLKAAHLALTKSIADNTQEAALTVISGYADQLLSDVSTITSAFSPSQGGSHGTSR